LAKKKKKMGRPPLLPEERMARRIDVRVTKAEWMAVQELAHEEGVSPTVFIRRIIQRALRRRKGT